MQITVNGASRQAADELTVAELLAQSGRTGRGVAVAVDGAVVPRAEHATTRIAPGARIEIVTAVQGG